MRFNNSRRDENNKGVLENFIMSIPRITRIWFLGTIIFSLIGRINKAYLYYFLLNKDLLFKEFQVMIKKNIK